MEIRKCTPADYPELLDVFNDAFGYARGWFQREMTHCTPCPSLATTQEIERHYICIIDGRIAGGLGAYPMDWTVTTSQGERRNISAYGIGQVSCLPEFRNRGVMTALMNASEEDMRRQGRAVGYLGGRRRRYGYYGYDFGGNVVKYRLDKGLLELYCRQAEIPIPDTTNDPSITIRQANLPDWPEINQAYETLPSYIHRSPRTWELQFARAGNRWFIGEYAGHKAYMCAQPEFSDWVAAAKETESNQICFNQICEIYGDPIVLAAMLLHQANSIGEDKSLHISHAAQNLIATPAGQMLYKTASHVGSEPIGLFAIVNTAKFLEEMGIDHNGIPLATKEAITRQLLNFTPLPEKQPYIQPMCAWISGVDSI